jgi:hypothetical protein
MTMCYTVHCRKNTHGLLAQIPLFTIYFTVQCKCKENEKLSLKDNFIAKSVAQSACFF